MKILLIPLALAAVSPAIAADNRPVHHYVRSNSDGSEREDVVVFARSATAIDVMKAKSRCTSAAYVTAQLDDVSGQTRALVGGRLQRDGNQQPVAWLFHHAASRRLTAHLGSPEAPPVFDIPAGARWVLYDFDFSDLIARPSTEIGARKDFSFEFPLLLTGEGQPTMRNLGELHLRFAGNERHGRRRALAYRASGPALGNGEGKLWFDARSHVLLEAKLPLANHSEYRDFRLQLVKSERGEAAWKKRLMQHWKGCPAPRQG